MVLDHLNGLQYGTPTPYPGLTNGIVPLTSSSIYGTETPYPDLANGIRPLDGSQYGTPTPYPGLTNGNCSSYIIKLNIWNLNSIPRPCKWNKTTRWFTSTELQHLTQV